MLWKRLLLLILLAPLTANAAFWDDAINKVKKFSEETVNQSIESIKGSEDNQNNPSSQSSNAQTEAAPSNQFDNPKELNRLVLLAMIHYHPEALDDDKWFKNAANTLYPEEAKAFYNNEFAWQKGKASIKARALKDAENPLLTFHVSPWTNPNGGRLKVGDYDFNRNAFKIVSSFIRPPVGSRPYYQKLAKATPGWLPVPPEVAEKLVQSSTFSNSRDLYGEFDFAITGAEKYEGNKGISLTPIIHFDEVKLYNRSSSYSVSGKTEFEYVATLMMPKVTAQKSEPSPAKKKEIVKQKKEPPAPAPEPKSSPVEKVKQAEPKPKDPLADLGPYERVEKGSPYGPDIVSLQLGMTLEEADKLIREHKKPRDVIIGKAPKPFVSAKGYLLEPGDESISIFTLNSPAGERIAGYIRYVYFNPDKHPSQVAVASSLDKKYGKPSYSYEVTGNFERRWLTSAQGKLGVGDQYGHVKGLAHCEKAAGARSGAKVFSGEKQGHAYLWMLPWQKGGSLSATLWHLKPGNGRIDQPNRCGSVLEAAYGDGSGTVTGPTLMFKLFDTPWLVEEISKQKAAEKAQGAKGLDL